MQIDPVRELSIVKAAAEVTTKLYEVVKSIKDRDVKEKLDGLLDELRELKREAAQLEDENRELREKLRFKSDEFEFKNPFWFERAHPERPLCPKCFVNRKISQMSEPYEGHDLMYRRCLHCGTVVDFQQIARRRQGIGYAAGGYEGPDSWMR